MKILAIGDIVGERAVEKLEEELPMLIQEKQVDFVVANGENAANGNGINKELFERILACGVDVVTMGNHTWGNTQIYDLLDRNEIIRPANCSKTVPGKGYTFCEKEGKTILVINLLGRKYMQGVYNADNPFVEVEEILKKEKADYIVVDFHAQGTGEKYVMAHFLDGKVSFVFGTHTHVQTADEKILPKGTGFITDIGMTGPNFSCLGTDPDNDLLSHYKDIPIEDILSNNPCMINGCIFELEERTGKTIQVERVICY